MSGNMLPTAADKQPTRHLEGWFHNTDSMHSCTALQSQTFLPHLLAAVELLDSDTDHLVEVDPPADPELGVVFAVVVLAVVVLAAVHLAAVDLAAVDLGAVDLGAVDRGAVDLGAEDLGAVDLGAVDLAPGSKFVRLGAVADECFVASLLHVYLLVGFVQFVGLAIFGDVRSITVVGEYPHVFVHESGCLIWHSAPMFHNQWEDILLLLFHSQNYQKTDSLEVHCLLHYFLSLNLLYHCY